MDELKELNVVQVNGVQVRGLNWDRQQAPRVVYRGGALTAITVIRRNPRSDASTSDGGRPHWVLDAILQAALNVEAARRRRLDEGGSRVDFLRPMWLPAQRFGATKPERAGLEVAYLMYSRVAMRSGGSRNIVLDVLTPRNPSLEDSSSCEVCWAVVPNMLMYFHRAWHGPGEGPGSSSGRRRRAAGLLSFAPLVAALSNRPRLPHPSLAGRGHECDLASHSGLHPATLVWRGDVSALKRFRMGGSSRRIARTRTVQFFGGRSLAVLKQHPYDAANPGSKSQAAVSEMANFAS